MNRSVFLAKFAEFGIVLACFANAAGFAVACTNEYEREETPEQKAEFARWQASQEASRYMGSLVSGNEDFPTDERLEELRLAAAEGDYRAQSDYAVGLIRRGHARRAVGLLQAAEAEHPGEYIVAANLGTAYELVGDDERALQWIAEGLRRNPRSHNGSEWLHAKILQAKLETAKDPDWLRHHSIVGLNFGSGFYPVSPGETAVDLDGHGKTLKEVRAALEYQLRERLSLVGPPDMVVANLLFDLGNLLMIDQLPRHAKLVYHSADGYSESRVPLIHSRFVASRFAWRDLPTELPALVVFLGLFVALVIAVGLYLRQFLRRPKPAAA
ncbi:MAG TPA: hypothetical protein VMF30_04000 [Pirellulales bacterium]|nr:hypothetical protein [Pirellulales bacterium]